MFLFIGAVCIITRSIVAASQCKFTHPYANFGSCMDQSHIFNNPYEFEYDIYIAENMDTYRFYGCTNFEGNNYRPALKGIDLTQSNDLDCVRYISEIPGEYYNEPYIPASEVIELS